MNGLSARRKPPGVIAPRHGRLQRRDGERRGHAEIFLFLNLHNYILNAILE